MADGNEAGSLPIDWLKTVYPDATRLFEIKLRPLEEVKDDCIVVLDTNILLTPYAIGPKSLDELGRTYRHLIEQDRLRIPGQVAREFVKNRAAKLEELFQQLSRKQSGLPKLVTGRYPLLEPIDAYQHLIQAETELDAHQKAYKEAVAALLEHVRSWVWNDPVSELYGELFIADVVVESKIDAKALADELERRHESRIPPGYKDSAKPDQGVGDLLIWLTILDLAASLKKHLLFVSGDEKSDWWHRSEGQPLYPRFELVEEYSRLSGGCSFYVARLSHFLDMFGVQADVVAEVRKEEAESQAPPTRPFFDQAYLRQAEQAVAEWTRARYGALEVQINVHNGPDILILDEDEENVGIEVVVLRGPNPVRIMHRIRDLAYRGNWHREKFVLTVFAIAIVTDDSEAAQQVVEFLKRRNFDWPETHLHVGYMHPDGPFEEVEEVRL